MRIPRTWLLLAALAAARLASASNVRCRFVFDAALFTSPPDEVAARCAAEVARAPSVQALECLLLTQHAAGVVPVLRGEARAQLERIVRETPAPGALDFEPRLVTLAAEVLALSAPAETLPVLHALLEPPAQRHLLARAARLAPRVADEAALQLLSLHVVSPDAELRRGVLRGLARTGSDEVFELLVPMLSDPDERLAALVLDGLVHAPAASTKQLVRVLRETPRSRRPLLANALATRLEPRAGRRDPHDDVLSDALRDAALAHCGDATLSGAFVTASLRAAGSGALEAWRMLADEATREAPLPCASWRRPLGLGLLERAGFETEPALSSPLATTAARLVERSPRAAFDELTRAMARRLARGGRTPLAAWLTDTNRTLVAVEAVRWGGGSAEAAELRRFAGRAFTEDVPNCTTPDLLARTFMSIVAAERRTPGSAQRR